MSDVRDFGASGDGATDDTDAIRHAVSDGDGHQVWRHLGRGPHAARGGQGEYRQYYLPTRADMIFRLEFLFVVLP